MHKMNSCFFDFFKVSKNELLTINNNYIEYESRGDKDKHLSPEDYLDIIRKHLRDMINNYKALNSIIIED